ncbi:MAG: C-terminal binding protein [Actinobacteria bacterium]|nr:C-terminal binding protein [Actinomycetota bacterium]
MSANNFKVVRLNSNTYPLIADEENELKKVGAYMVCIEGSSSAEIIETAKDCDALLVISAKVRAEVINKLSKCRIIARYGIGVDNIDVDTATIKGIIVTNVPDFCENEMGEHTMALLLGVARKIVVMDKITRNCKWSVRIKEHMRRIYGQSLGLIGFGSAARAVAIRAINFGLKIYSSDPFIDESEMKKYNVEKAALDFIIKNCDFISLHIPLNPNTYHLIGECELKSMKKSAILINTSRGAIVDEDKLVLALKEGWISGAGIDVFEKINAFDESEKKIDNPLFHLENVILSPHSSACSIESLIEVKQKAIKSVVDVLSGKWPKNCVNPTVSPGFLVSK